MGYIQLRNYAEWYYTKYFPSRKMLYEKLLFHSEEEDLVERVMADLSSLIVEDKVIESRIYTYLSLGKTARYIRTKLAQKKFDMTLVDQFLSEKNDIIKNPETYRPIMERHVQKGATKGLSKKALSYELSMIYPDARDIIRELLSEYDDRELLQKKAPELLKKYSQEQVVGKLLKKGFHVGDIYTVLRRR